jgi:hypothetical protein
MRVSDEGRLFAGVEEEGKRSTDVEARRVAWENYMVGQSGYSEEPKEGCAAACLTEAGKIHQCAGRATKEEELNCWYGQGAPDSSSKKVLAMGLAWLNEFAAQYGINYALAYESAIGQWRHPKACFVPTDDDLTVFVDAKAHDILYNLAEDPGNTVVSFLGHTKSWEEPRVLLYERKRSPSSLQDGPPESSTWTQEMLTESVTGIMKTLDANNDGMISTKEFKQIVEMPEAVKALQVVDVKPIDVNDFADRLFLEDGRAVEIPFDRFMSRLLEIRSANKKRGRIAILRLQGPSSPRRATPA